MNTNTPSEIITFYSYKGGTGRSMALSNVACILAEESVKNKGVLMIDWDLEAPGLHRFFDYKFMRKLEERNECTKELDKCPGLIDLFIELESIVGNEKFDDDEEAEKNANDLIESIDLKKFIIKTDIPNLSLLKAGCFDESYSTKVNTFNWEKLYNRSPYLFSLLAEKLCKYYKYVLIDSRTGYTDISGICTALMPQKLVVVFTPNRQNYMGVSEIIRRATSYRRTTNDMRPLLVYPLPSRIESSQDDLRVEWRFGASEKNIIGYQPMFQEIFKEVYDLRECSLNAYFEDVQIQQNPEFAYGEKIAVKTKETEDRFSLSKSYRIFANWLLNSYTPWQRLNRNKDTPCDSLAELCNSQGCNVSMPPLIASLDSENTFSTTQKSTVLSSSEQILEEIVSTLTSINLEKVVILRVLPMEFTIEGFGSFPQLTDTYEKIMDTVILRGETTNGFWDKTIYGRSFNHKIRESTVGFIKKHYLPCSETSFIGVDETINDSGFIIIGESKTGFPSDFKWYKGFVFCEDPNSSSQISFTGFSTQDHEFIESALHSRWKILQTNCMKNKQYWNCKEYEEKPDEWRQVMEKIRKLVT